MLSSSLSGLERVMYPVPLRQWRRGIICSLITITFVTPQFLSASDLPATAPIFEVASIKADKSGDGIHIMSRMMNSPNDGRFYATNVTLKMLLRTAYGIQDSQIAEAPSWIDSERYDIEAKADSTVNEELKKLSPDQAKPIKQHMLQALLADRFKLALSRTTKDLPVYALVVAKNGPKLQQSKEVSPPPNEPNAPKTPESFKGGHMMRMGNGELNAQQVPMAFLVQFLAQELGRPVLDKTGLTGSYNFTLQWTPEEGHDRMPGGMAGGRPGPENGSQPEPSGPSIFTAVQEQLGLKLESQKGPVEVLAIQHVERPSEN